MGKKKRKPRKPKSYDEIAEAPIEEAEGPVTSEPEEHEEPLIDEPVSEWYPEEWIDPDVPGGNYISTQRPDGKWNIYDVPIFAAHKTMIGDDEFDLGDEWLSAAREVQQKRIESGYTPPLHVSHHDEDGGSAHVEYAGKWRISDVRMDMYEGEPTMMVFADFLAIPQGIYDRIRNGELSYRSVEILDITKPEIDSLSLLDTEVPYFRFPNLTVKEEEYEKYAMSQAYSSISRKSPYFLAYRAVTFMDGKRGTVELFKFQQGKNGITEIGPDGKRRHFGRGEPCKQGESAAKTGCIPKGEGTGKDITDAKSAMDALGGLTTDIENAMSKGKVELDKKVAKQVAKAFGKLMSEGVKSGALDADDVSVARDEMEDLIRFELESYQQDEKNGTLDFLIDMEAIVQETVIEPMKSDDTEEKQQGRLNDIQLLQESFDDIRESSEDLLRQLDDPLTDIELELGSLAEDGALYNDLPPVAKEEFITRLKDGIESAMAQLANVDALVGGVMSNIQNSDFEDIDGAHSSNLMSDVEDFNDSKDDLDAAMSALEGSFNSKILKRDPSRISPMDIELLLSPMDDAMDALMDLQRSSATLSETDTRDLEDSFEGFSAKGSERRKTYGQGEPCKQGESAAKTGCIPKAEEAGKTEGDLQSAIESGDPEQIQEKAEEFKTFGERFMEFAKDMLQADTLEDLKNAVTEFGSSLAEWADEVNGPLEQDAKEELALAGEELKETIEEAATAELEGPEAVQAVFDDVDEAILEAQKALTGGRGSKEGAFEDRMSDLSDAFQRLTNIANTMERDDIVSEIKEFDDRALDAEIDGPNDPDTVKADLENLLEDIKAALTDLVPGELSFSEKSKQRLDSKHGSESPTGELSKEFSMTKEERLKRRAEREARRQKRRAEREARRAKKFQDEGMADEGGSEEVVLEEPEVKELADMLQDAMSALEAGDTETAMSEIEAAISSLGEEVEEDTNTVDDDNDAPVDVSASAAGNVNPEDLTLAELLGKYDALEKRFNDREEEIKTEEKINECACQCEQYGLDRKTAKKKLSAIVAKDGIKAMYGYVQSVKENLTLDPPSDFDGDLPEDAQIDPVAMSYRDQGDVAVKLAMRYCDEYETTKKVLRTNQSKEKFVSHCMAADGFNQ